MTAAEWISVWLGAPAFIGAVTALVIALKSNGQSSATLAALVNHLTGEQHP